MCTSARLFQCALCSRQTVICRHCDRGQQYCSAECSDKARQISLKRANEKYRRSTRSQHANAQRQRRYRQRQQKKVTYQGSPPAEVSVSWLLSVITVVLASSNPVTRGFGCTRCHFCQRRIHPFLRRDFLGRQSVYRSG